MDKDWVDVGGHQRGMKGVLQGIAGGAVMISDRKSGTLTVPLDKIHSAQLVLTDALIAATKPIDTTGAEEILETEEE
jgi:ribosome maturation factor RimP